MILQLTSEQGVLDVRAAPAEGTGSGASEPEIAYILKGFPRTSETFITNEIYLLETLGLTLALFSIKRLEGQKLNGNVARVRAKVEYLPDAEPINTGPFVQWLLQTVPQFKDAHWRAFRRRPTQYLAALGEALGMCWRYGSGPFSPKKVFIKEFLQAGYIANEIQRTPSIRHLHAHFCHGATTVTMLAARICGLPFSFTAHAKDIYLKDLNPGDLLQRKFARARFAVTCTCANQQHLDEIRPKGSRLHTIYHGLDISLFTRASRRRSTAVPLILSVGRFVEKKGFSYLVDACRILADRGYRFECRIIGGHDVYFGPVKQRVEELGVGHLVSLCSAVTQEALKEAYEQATVFALPCLVVENGDRDGIPNVLVEAMAMQVPVVSTAISGIPELVESGVNGILVAEKDAEALADGIASLLDSDATRLRYGMAGKQKVRRLFDARQNTAHLKSLFDQYRGEPDSAC